MLKSKRLADYRFPYAILISKLIDFFGVDATNERNDLIKAVSEIDNSTHKDGISQSRGQLGGSQRQEPSSRTWSLKPQQ